MPAAEKRRRTPEQIAPQLQRGALGEQEHAGWVMRQIEAGRELRRDALVQPHLAGRRGLQQLGGFLDHAADRGPPRQARDPERHHHRGLGQVQVYQQRRARGQHRLIQRDRALGQGHHDAAAGQAVGLGREAQGQPRLQLGERRRRGYRRSVRDGDPFPSGGRALPRLGRPGVGHDDAAHALFDHGELGFLPPSRAGRDVREIAERRQRAQHLRGRGPALGMLGQHARYQVADRSRHLGHQVRQMRRILEHELGQQHARLVTAEGGLARQALVGYAAEREDIRAPVDHAGAVDRLGRQVAGRTHQIARAGQAPARVHQASNAEVEQLELVDPTIDEKEIMRLDVAVNDVMGMGIGQRLGGLLEQHDGVGQGWRLARQPLRQILALEPLHHQVALVAHHTVRQVAHDGRVLERGQDVALLHEALTVAVLTGAQHLHAHLHVRNHVARSVDLAHPAGRNYLLQAKPATDQPGTALSPALASTGCHQIDYAPDPGLRYLGPADRGRGRAIVRPRPGPRLSPREPYTWLPFSTSRAMTSFWISVVPSPISASFTSRR